MLIVFPKSGVVGDGADVGVGGGYLSISRWLLSVQPGLADLTSESWLFVSQKWLHQVGRERMLRKLTKSMEV